jgi:steroid 5-alpha reductase family enzyme
MTMTATMTILALSLAVTLAAFALLWAWSARARDSGVVDFYWGPGFAVIGTIGLARLDAPSPAQLAFVVLTGMWAARLTFHLVRRHRSCATEDPRYAAMREAGGPNFVARSFLTIFMLQAVVMWLVAAPVHVATTTQAARDPGLISLLGALLFFAGLAIETMADAQLARFKADPRNRGRLFTEGLFAWSRHPNYLGESLLWWGLALIAFDIAGSFLAFAGPALLTLLLLKVSGVPMLDAHLASREGFADYARRVPAFLPRPPARDAAGETAESRR